MRQLNMHKSFIYKYVRVRISFNLAHTMGEQASTIPFLELNSLIILLYVNL